MTTDNTATDPALGGPVSPEVVRRNAYEASHDVARSINVCRKREPGDPGYEALRVLLGQHYPVGDMARQLLDMWRDNLISITASVHGKDKNGIYEDADGSCVRDFDPESDHQVLGLRIAKKALPLPDSLIPDPALHPDARRAAARRRVAAEGDDF